MAKPTVTSFSELAPLLIQQYERFLPTAFDESLTLLQKVNKILKRLEELGKLTGDVIKQWNLVMEWVLNEGLNESIVAKVDQMVVDGLFDNIINTQLFGDLNTRISGAEATLNESVKDSIRISLSKFPRLVGETHDQPRIQRAVDYCIANGYTELLIPNKTYSVNTSIESKGIKFVGIGKPYIPFMTWDYTRPTSGLDHYSIYLTQCKGSIITTSMPITPFADGLIAENIGIFGNLRVSQGSGVTSPRGDKFVQLHGCMIAGFRDHGVNLLNGMIFLELMNGTVITQNGKYGVFIDKNLNGYTGETNLVKIHDCQIVRNELGAIKGNILGRSISIVNNDFEFTGEVGDPERTKPTGITDIKWAIDLQLYSNGGFSNGSINIEGNYSEETFGLVKLIAVDPTHGISIKNNMWKPYNNTNYSCGVLLGGWINGVHIESNTFTTNFDQVVFEAGNNIKNVSIDCDYKGKLKWDVSPSIERKIVDDNTFVNLTSNGLPILYSLPNGSVTGMRYVSGDGVTYLDISPAQISGTFWGGVDVGGDGEQRLKGYAVMVGGNMVGVINGQSSTTKTLNVRGSRVLSVGDGSLKIVRLGGINTVRGDGSPVKLVVDWDNTILTFGK